MNEIGNKLTKVFDQPKHYTSNVQFSFDAETPLNLKIRDVDAQHPTAVYLVTVRIHNVVVACFLFT